MKILTQNFPRTTNSLNSTVGRFGQRMVNSKLAGKVANDVLFDYGLGSEGMFNPHGMYIPRTGPTGLEYMYNTGLAYNAERALGNSVIKSAGNSFKGLGRGLASASWGARAGFAGRAGLRAIGPAIMLYSAYSGYKQGGVYGAAKSVASNSIQAALFSTALRSAAAIGGSAAVVAGGVALAAGVGYGAYKAMQYGNARIVKSRRLEMGHAIVDPFGNTATMRQRSLQALSFSQINGRSAFGNEAALMHMPAMR